MTKFNCLETMVEKVNFGKLLEISPRIHGRVFRGIMDENPHKENADVHS